MSYLIAVHPSIFSTVGTGLPACGVMTATVGVCFAMMLAMELFARLPFAVAPGMGLNAYLTC